MSARGGSVSALDQPLSERKMVMQRSRGEEEKQEPGRGQWAFSPKPELEQEPTHGDTDPRSGQGGTSEACLTGPKEIGLSSASFPPKDFCEFLWATPQSLEP